MAIVNIRGTNGSGKSTLVHRLLQQNPHEEITLYRPRKVHGRPHKVRPVQGYDIDVKGRRVIVVGRYATQCGGCDAIPTQDLVCEAVRRAAQLSSNVVFEGLLVSGIFSRYEKLGKELARAERPYVWALLRPPLSVCLERVYARNGGKPIKEELVAAKLKGVDSSAEKARDAGETVIDLPWRRPYPSFLRYLFTELEDE